MTTATATAAPRSSTARRAAALAAAGFGALAVFQAALAAGAPWGHAAWGGETANLPAAQQVGSGAAALVYAAATVIVLTRAGIIWPSYSGAALPRFGTWFLAVALALGALPNFASQSGWENAVFGPVALLLAALCTLVARNAPRRTLP
jgi:hypothetical protein